MPSFTRVKGSNTQVGTLYTPNTYAYLITVQNTTPTALDLQGEDSYGTDAQVDGIIEVIVKELNPLVWYTPADSTGKIHVVLDQGNNSASELQTRIRRLAISKTVTATTNASTTLAYAGATQSMLKATVVGSGIPANTVVNTVNAGVSLILSNSATTSVTNGSFQILSDISGTTVVAASSITIA